MAEDLHRLVYFSRNRVAGDIAALTRAIDDILLASRRNNAEVGVTGALMFNAGCFGQVLEGPRKGVQDVFARIQRDPRHGDVSLLTFEPVAARAFGDWSMGFVGHRARDAEIFAHVAEDSGFDPSQADGDALLAALRDLALRDEGKPESGGPPPLP